MWPCPAFVSAGVFRIAINLLLSRLMIVILLSLFYKCKPAIGEGGDAQLTTEFAFCFLRSNFVGGSTLRSFAGILIFIFEHLPLQNDPFMDIVLLTRRNLGSTVCPQLERRKILTETSLIYVVRLQRV